MPIPDSRSFHGPNVPPTSCLSDCWPCCIVLILVGGIAWITEKASSETKELNKKLTEVIYAPNRQKTLLNSIERYQKEISPTIKEKFKKEKICRFEPSCSEYAKAAIQKYGSVKGSFKSIGRILRCNPFSKGGYDPLI